MSVGALHTEYTYRYATTRTPCIVEAEPEIRRAKGMPPKSRSQDAVKHHSRDPFAASAPKMSDILDGINLQDSRERYEKLEEIQKRGAAYMVSYKAHRKKSKRAVAIRAAAIGADLLVAGGAASQFADAGQLTALGAEHAAQAVHSAGDMWDVAGLAGVNAVEAWNEHDLHRTLGPRDNQAARLEQIAEDYSQVAQRASNARNAIDPYLRHRLGESGRSQFISDIRVTDDLIPKYCRALAQTSHLGERFSNGVPHFGIMWAREFPKVMDESGATKFSSQLFTSVVREYGVVAHEHNRLLDGVTRIVAGGVIERSDSRATGNLRDARFAHRAGYARSADHMSAWDATSDS